MATNVFTLETGLRLDSAADIQPHLAPLKQHSTTTTEVRVAGSTLGVGASEELARELQTLEHLEYAGLDNIFTTRSIDEIPPALTALCKSLILLPKLTSLNLSDNAFGVRSVECIVPFLTQHSQLETLILSNNGLGPEGGSEIAKALKASGERATKENRKSTLRRIICRRNRLESGSAPEWGDMFSHHPLLIEVRLSQNDIRKEGWIKLLAGLSKCTQLEVLDLWDNTATEVGSEALARALPHWSNLKELNAADCLLGSEGGIAISTALASGSNPLLETLELNGSEIDEESISLIADAIKEHGKHLKLVNICDNDGDEEAMKELTGPWGDVKTALEGWKNDAKLITTEDEDEDSEVEEDDGDADELTAALSDLHVKA